MPIIDRGNPGEEFSVLDGELGLLDQPAQAHQRMPYQRKVYNCHHRRAMVMDRPSVAQRFLQ